MTRITERSPYYPDGVRRTSTTAATHFLPDLMPDGTLNSIYARPVHDCELGGIVPSMGSIELAYEPDGEEGTWAESVRVDSLRNLGSEAARLGWDRPWEMRIHD